MTSSVRAEYCDEDVKRRIDSFLATKHFPEFRHLQITVDDGAVSVTGTVDSFYAKQVALHTCQRVAGVQELIDEIEVTEKGKISETGQITDIGQELVANL